MTNRPDWPASAAALADVSGPDVQIGLHLNLTLGSPLTAAPQLAPDGRFPTIGALLRGKTLPAGEIRAEIDAQLAAFTAALGRPPAFVDGHQHVQILPVVRTALLDALQALGMGSVWLRDSGDRPDRILRRQTNLAKAFGIAWIARGFADAARARGFATNAGFSGFSAFEPAAALANQFGHYLQAPGPRHLVMCHPGYVDDELRAVDPVTTTREQELAFLLSPEWPALLAQAGLTLGRWDA